MLVLKRALLNVQRHHWQHVLIGSLLLLLIYTALSAGLIFISTKKFAENYAQRFTPIITILPKDLNTTHEEKLTKEQYLKLGQSDSVNQTKVVSNMQVSFDYLKTLNESNDFQVETLDSTTIQTAQIELNMLQGIDKEGLKNELFQRHQEVITGTVDIGLNECLISDTLAKLNDLTVGDTIKITTTVDERQENKILTIAGIYQSKKIAGIASTPEWEAFQANDIFTSWETVVSMKNFKRLGYIVASYELKDQKSNQKFMKELKNTDNMANYYVMTNDTNKELMLSPVNGMKIFSGSLFLGILIFGTVGLVLLSGSRFKHAQAEIYLLKSAGITNKELILSRLIESLFVSIVSSAASFVIVFYTVQGLANWQLSSQKQMVKDFEQLSNAISNESSQFIHSVPVVIDGNALLGLLTITSLFIIGIIFIDVYKIVRFNPIEFLLERNLDE